MTTECTLGCALDRPSDRAFDRLEAPKCKFCAGRLRFDFERKARAPGFSYFRCEQCDMPNVFAAATFAAAAPA